MPGKGAKIQVPDRQIEILQEIPRVRTGSLQMPLRQDLPATSNRDDRLVFRSAKLRHELLHL